MVERKPMTEEDFIAVTDANINLFPEWVNYSDDQKRYLAKVNIMTGTAESYYDNGLIGIGGIRYLGLGEAWFVLMPELKNQDIRRAAAAVFIKERFEEQRDRLNLWRVFAEAKTGEDYLLKLGFEKQPNTMIWTRT